MDYLTLLVPKGSLNVDTEHRAICITKDSTGRISVDNHTRNETFHAARLRKTGTVVVRPVSQGYAVVAFVDLYVVAEAPPDVKNFIFNSKLLKAGPGEKIEYLDLFIGQSDSGKQTYWVRVKEVE